MVAKKIRVAVLYGGQSGEHEVSLVSAASVIKNLDPDRFEVMPIGIDKQGHWLLNDAKHLLADPTLKSLPLHTAQTQAISNPLAAKTDVAAKNSGQLFDVVFPVLHGTLGEDGTMQGLFELMNIPYVGAAVLGSAVGMDKDVSKRLVAAAGLRVPDFIAVKLGQWISNSQKVASLINSKFSYPLFVKPANTGSSVGVHKVKKPEDLAAAIDDAFLYDKKILIEKAIAAREIELSVLENIEVGAAPLVSIPGEIVPRLEFYSYRAKYLDANGADLLIPAPLEPAQIKEAQQLAVRVFELLECEGMARVDLFLEKNTGEFYFNEVNTIPGFTQISMYPKLWEASGLAYKDLLTKLVELALVRHEQKRGLKREWAIADAT